MQDNQQSSDLNLVFATLPAGMLQCNCTIVADKKSGKGVVIDPGGSTDEILAAVKELGVEIVGIYFTHAHYDHVVGASEIKKATGAPLFLSEKDKFLWDGVEMQCKAFGFPCSDLPDIDNWIEDGDNLLVGDGVAIPTPGHSPGSMSFYFERDKVIVVGDLLFKFSVGRTDLWGGSFKDLQKSIREKVFVLDDDTFVITGHGPETDVGSEKKGNPHV